VRESIFDVLFSLGGVEGWRVADLFTGTGALGIEALSRGAASAVFVDRDPGSVAAVRTNLAAVGLGDAERDGRATVVRADASVWRPPADAHVDLVLCDPPYGFDGWSALLAGLPAGLVVAESGAEVPLPEGWEMVRSRRYGGTIVTVARPDRATEKGAS
jgi:16S rRNA (guanine966-N2)-methyltransferase